MVLKVTDFTHRAGFVCFIHIEYNSVVIVSIISNIVVIVVVVVVVVVVVIIVVRNGCCDDYLPQVMLCLFFWNMNHENESGRKCWLCMRSKYITVGKFILHKYDPWECKECTHVHNSSKILACCLGE